MGIRGGANTCEFDRVVTRRNTFIKAQLAGLALGEWQASGGIDDGEAHPDFSLGFDGKRSDGLGRAYLTAGVATRLAPSPIRSNFRGP